MAGPARAIRRGAKSARSGIRPGSPSRRHWSRAKLIDAPPHGIKLKQITANARDYDLAVLHTSAPSFASDVETIKALKAANAGIKIGFIGAKVAVDPDDSLQASPLIDFVARNEFDFTIKEVADGRPWSEIAGLSYRNAAGVHHPQ